MKTRLWLAAFLAASAHAAALDVAAVVPPPTPAVNAVFVDPESPEATAPRKIGESAINRLAITMVNEIGLAVSKGTIESAVEVAHLKSLPMAGDRIAGLPQIKAVKRTSLRLRNPANAPDAADQLALDRVLHALTTNGDVPNLLVQRIDIPNAAPEWRVYRPLGVMPTCLKCHGDLAEQSPALRAKLAAAYPGDNAAGFHAGEWRGLLRVTVDLTPAPTAKPVSGATASR